jgi:putative oxidoreductase
MSNMAVTKTPRAQSHLANWDTTLELFSDDYKVPLLPPDLAAYMAVAIEATTPFLLVAGFLTGGRRWCSSA